jgi:hypothetical protein
MHISIDIFDLPTLAWSTALILAEKYPTSPALYTFLNTFKCICICLYVNINMCISIYMYTYIYIYMIYGFNIRWKIPHLSSPRTGRNDIIQEYMYTYNIPYVHIYMNRNNYVHYIYIYIYLSYLFFFKTWTTIYFELIIFKH